jgi:hypothetical protein
MLETWKMYPYDIRFKVSSLGRTRFEGKPPKTIKPRKNGYYFVCTYLGKKVQYPVHQMVLETFIGVRPPGATCSHLDGNPSNNVLTNLAWETHSVNCMRKHQHGTSQGGERNGSAKLTQLQVAEIRASKLGSRRLAPIYGVSDAHIRNIRRGDTW